LSSSFEWGLLDAYTGVVVVINSYMGQPLAGGQGHWVWFVFTGHRSIGVLFIWFICMGHWSIGFIGFIGFIGCIEFIGFIGFIGVIFLGSSSWVHLPGFIFLGSSTWVHLHGELGKVGNRSSVQSAADSATDTATGDSSLSSTGIMGSLAVNCDKHGAHGSLGWSSGAASS
jgi:hypothetical protein